MLVDKQNELMGDLLFTAHQHGGDDVTWKPPIAVLSLACDISWLILSVKTYSYMKLMSDVKQLIQRSHWEVNTIETR